MGILSALEAFAELHKGLLVHPDILEMAAEAAVCSARFVGVLQTHCPSAVHD